MLVGVGAPWLVLGATDGLDGPGWDVALSLGLYGIPLVIVWLVSGGDSSEAWVGGDRSGGVVAVIFAFTAVMRAAGLPERFREGVGAILVWGGLAVGAVARGHDDGDDR